MPFAALALITSPVELHDSFAFATTIVTTDASPSPVAMFARRLTSGRAATQSRTACLSQASRFGPTRFGTGKAGGFCSPPAAEG